MAFSWVEYLTDEILVDISFVNLAKIFGIQLERPTVLKVLRNTCRRLKQNGPLSVTDYFELSQRDAALHFNRVRPVLPDIADLGGGVANCQRGAETERDSAAPAAT